MNSTSDPQTQALLDAQRKAHRNQPGSFKEDALTDKVVSVEPDGTGPTPTSTEVWVSCMPPSQHPVDSMVTVSNRGCV